MDGHFRAFSFVDRITEVEPGVRVRGHYAVPSGLDVFPASLVAEAVGQLAAWSAMAAIDFTHRPLAGIASRVEILSAVHPGQVIELAADLESADADAVAYGGVACVNGTPVVRLVDCVGPMAPLDAYDDPQAVRDRFALLCGPGATPGGFQGFPALALERAGGERGQSVRVNLAVPAAEPFFADHFPRRPLFPGTLLLQANLEAARGLAAELSNPPGSLGWTVRTVSDIKLRTFTLPGDLVEIEVKLAERSGDTARLDVLTRNGRRTVSTAQVVFTSAACP